MEWEKFQAKRFKNFLVCQAYLNNNKIWNVSGRKETFVYIIKSNYLILEHETFSSTKYRWKQIISAWLIKLPPLNLINSIRTLRPKDMPQTFLIHYFCRS